MAVEHYSADSAPVFPSFSTLQVPPSLTKAGGLASLPACGNTQDGAFPTSLPLSSG